MEEIKKHIDTAFAALCQIQVSGPAAIPYARALEELAAAAVKIKTARKQREDGGGET